MIEVMGEMYYIDLKSISNTVEIPPKDDMSGDTEQTINLVSFEVVKMLLEIIMSEREEFDDNLGIIASKNLSIPFKIAFNTLLKHEILKHL